MTAQKLISRLPRVAKAKSTRRLRCKHSQLTPHEWLKVAPLARKRHWFWMEAAADGLTFMYLPR